MRAYIGGDIICTMFFDHQEGRRCGLHAVRNLLETADLTSENMNDAAHACVEESKDFLHNHLSSAGDWSMDTVKKILYDRGYVVQRAVQIRETATWAVPTMEECMEDANILGFIVQANNHYTSIRKNDGNWVFCDSMLKAPRNVSAQSICREALYERCNLFLVRRM